MKRICTLALIIVGSLAGSHVHAQGINLANTKWIGTENLAGFGKLEFQFHNGGGATMIDAKETSQGQWSFNQNKVTISFYNGQAQYHGMINGNQMKGTATNGETTWAWSVANMSPAPAQIPLPNVGPKNGPINGPKNGPINGPKNGPTNGPINGPKVTLNSNVKLTPQTLPDYLQKAGYTPKVVTPAIGSPICLIYPSDNEWTFVVEASVDAKGTVWLVMQLDQVAELKATMLTKLLEANNTVAPCFFVYRSEDTRILLKLECIGGVQDNVATLMRMTKESYSLWSSATSK